jgi:hypothetical protein
MTLSIRSIDPVSRPFFAGEATGIDITRPLAADQAAAIEQGMDRYGVLVFRDQHFDDESQLAFSRNFGALEKASGDLNWGKARRIASDLVNDISNLDNDNQVMGLNDRKRLFGLGTASGTPTAPSRRSPPNSPCSPLGLYPPPAATPNSLTCAPRMTRWTPQRKLKLRIWSANIASSIHGRCSGSRTSRTRTAFASSRFCNGWCEPTLRPGASRCILHRTLAPSSAGQYRKREPCCAI